MANKLEFLMAYFRHLLIEGLSGPNTPSKNNRLKLRNSQIWDVTYAR
jgi:hypothetical protein